MSDMDPGVSSPTASPGGNLYTWLVMQAERAPEAIAITAPGRKPLTYSHLRKHLDYVRETLHALGFGRHDRIALVLPNGPELAVAFLSVASAATSAPLNPAYRANEFDFYLADLQANALMIHVGIDSPAIAVAQRRGIAILECVPIIDAEAGLFTLNGAPRQCAAGLQECPRLPSVAAPDDVALVLHTSGTTARPKLVPLTHMNLCTSARNLQVALELTEADRCLNVMPLFHIHGLIGAALASLLVGASVVCTADFDVTTFFAWLDACHPTWYTAVPTMHQAILTRAKINRDIIARHPLRFIRSSSAPLPPSVMADLEREFQAPVIEAYGMTEATHQMASNPLPPRARKAGSVGVAAGPEIVIMDDGGHVLPWGRRGEIVIRGASVMRGYEHNPTVNTQAFTHGWFRTGDQGFFDAEGYLFITGRLKELINRGGEKISPREVDDVLMEHPAIAQVVTFAVPDGLLGEDIAAAVVLREHASATEREIQAFAAARLADFKVPRRVILLHDIPPGATGKLQRMGLAETLGLTFPDPTYAQPARRFVAPRDPLERQLAQIWETVLAMAPIGIQDNFFELGGHSLLAVRLLEAIEQVTGHNLPLATLFQASTVEQLADLLRQEGWAGLWSPLVAIQAAGSRPPFFFVHAVSGNVLNYRDLSRNLGPDQPFYGLQAQGLDGHQAPHTRIEEMAACYIHEIRTRQPDGPYVLGGGSSGGVVAFEMAQQLSAQGQTVALLALFDTYFPVDLRNQSSPAVSRSTSAHVLHKVDRHIGNLLLLSPRDRLRYLLRTVGWIKTKLERTVQRMTHAVTVPHQGILPRALEQVLQANRQALSHYVPQVYQGQITLFLSHEAPDRTGYDRRLGWHDMAAAGLEVHVVPGSHETLFAEPHVRVLADILWGCLQRF